MIGAHEYATDSIKDLRLKWAVTTLDVLVILSIYLKGCDECLLDSPSSPRCSRLDLSFPHEAYLSTQLHFLRNIIDILIMSPPQK